MGQQNPDRLAHGSGQVSDAGIRSNNQVQRGCQRRCFGQVFFQARPVPDKNISGQTGQLIRGRAFLQRDPGDAGHAQQRQQGFEIH